MKAYSFTSHLNALLWSLDRYRDFLQTRRNALAECMNAFIRIKAGLT